MTRDEKNLVELWSRKYYDKVEELNRAEQKLAVAIECLDKTIKENTFYLNWKSCEHDWEPDTLMEVMRCDICGIGLNTFESMQALAKIKERPSE